MLRLKTRPQFQAVLKGATLARTAHFSLHCCALESPVAHDMSAAPLFPTGALWFGAMVPKRWAKRAVTRNCIKRQIYNVSAEFESALNPGAHLVRLRSGFERSQFISASSDLLRAAVRAELLILFTRAQSGESATKQGVATCP